MKATSGGDPTGENPLEPPLRTTGKQRGGVTGKGFLPGRSGNAGGRPGGDALMRKRLLQSFHENENEAMAALARRWASTKHVQEMVELLAKLEGEFTRESQEVGSRGISVIVIRGEGAIDPAEFRRNCEARMAREAEREGEPQVSRRSER